jgi:hypothetical protein
MGMPPVQKSELLYPLKDSPSISDPSHFTREKALLVVRSKALFLHSNLLLKAPCNHSLPFAYLQITQKGKNSQCQTFFILYALRVLCGERLTHRSFRWNSKEVSRF